MYRSNKYWGCVTAPPIFYDKIFFYTGFIIKYFFIFLFPIRDIKDNIFDIATDYQ